MWSPARRGKRVVSNSQRRRRKREGELTSHLDRRASTNADGASRVVLALPVAIGLASLLDPEVLTRLGGLSASHSVRAVDSALREESEERARRGVRLLAA